MERALHLIAVGVLTSLLGFFMTDALPGDAALAALGERATPEQVAALRADLGLERSWPLRYVDWLSHAVRGDLGVSTRTGDAVAPLVWQRFSVSAYLMVLTQCLALAIAIPLALLAVSGAPPWVDRLTGAVSLTLLSTPAYILALGLTLVFAIWLGWLPASGYVPPGDSISGTLGTLFLPALSLALVELPIYLRVLRRELADTLAQPWVRTARAFGANNTQVLLGEALRSASLPLVALIALNVGHLLAGAVVIEAIYALPGMGRLLLDAVLARDLPTVQACIVVVAIVFVVVNLIADLLTARLDPRTR